MSKTKKSGGPPLALAVAVALLLLFLLLLLTGFFRLGDPSDNYELRGVDVSSYQGDIDWAVIEQNDVSFAFIKATEGSAHTDPHFAANWAGVAETDIVAGAYHFLSFESPGKTQAQNFIDTVGKRDGMLPPAIDLEYYGSYADSPPSRELVREILDEMAAALRDYYGADPILYVNESLYRKYIAGDAVGFTVWVVDTLGTPRLASGGEWAFWQYSHQGSMPGYSGVEQRIDLNVFRGTKDELLALTI